MTIDDLKGAWLHVEARGDAPARELDAVKERVRRLDAVVRRRDRIETLVALSLLPIFGYFAFGAPRPLARAGAAIVALACLLTPLCLRWARRRAPDPGVPLQRFLELELEFVVRQRRLLLSVPLWYLGPLGVGVVLFFAGGSAPVWLTAVYGVGVLAFFVYLYRLNRAAVLAEIAPRERELRALLQIGREEPR